jgi:hypothetical protein
MRNLAVLSFLVAATSVGLGLPGAISTLPTPDRQLTTIMESIANQKKSLKALLDEKKDHQRILLLYSRDNAQHYVIEQQEALHPKDVAAGLAERDLDVIVLIASTLPEPDRQFLTHSEFKLVPAEGFQGWLVGKDGGIKHTFKAPIDPQELFRLIDSMPMRQAETKKQ